MGDAYDDYEQRMLWNQMKGGFHKPKRRQRYTWKMRDGSVIYFDEMSDSHLQNCINLVERRDGKCETLYALLDEQKRRQK